MTTDATTDATTRSQLRGLCAACGNQQAVRASGLAQHGYRRPWEGAGNIGPCLGSGRQPHELSPDLAQDVLRYLASDLSRAEGWAEALRSPDLTEVQVKARDGWTKLHRVTAEKWEWNQAVQSAIRNAESTVKLIQREHARVAGLLVDWAPRPLVEAKVETAATRAARREEAIPDFIPEEVTLVPRKNGLAIYHAGGRNFAVVQVEDRKVLERCGTRKEALKVCMRQPVR